MLPSRKDFWIAGHFRMETTHKCQYCEWSWKDICIKVVESPQPTVCNGCLFRENQTPESITETRDQMSLLFPKCRAGSRQFEGYIKLYADGSTADQEPIEAHPLLLAIKSPVLNEMLTTMKDCKITIKETSATLLQAVVKFMYTGEISYSAELGVSHEAVLKFAHKYMIDELKKACVAEISKHVLDESLCSVLQLSLECNAGDLQKAALGCFWKQRKYLESGIVEGVFKLAHEYQLEELKKACEIELSDRLSRHTNLVSMLAIATEGKGVILLTSTVIFFFLQRHTHRRPLDNVSDVLQTVLNLSHLYLKFKCIHENNIQNLRGAFEIGLMDILSQTNLFSMLALPCQERASMFSSGAVKFIKIHFDCLYMTDLAGDILKFADQYGVCDLKRACEIELCKKITQGNLYEKLELGDQCNAIILMAKAINYFSAHLDQMEYNSRVAVEELLGGPEGGQLENLLRYTATSSQEEEDIELQQACEVALSRKITASNALLMLQLSKDCCALLLKREVLKFLPLGEATVREKFRS